MRLTKQEILDRIKGQLIVSCQALPVSYTHLVLLAGCVNSLNRLNKVLGCPSACLFVDVLHSISSLEDVFIDCHSVRSHTQRILVTVSYTHLRPVFGGGSAGGRRNQSPGILEDQVAAD